MALHAGSNSLQSHPLNERWLPKGLTLVMSNVDINILTAAMKAISQKYKS
jgi:hypothetical protein